MNRLTIFAHWDPGDDVRPFVLKHLSALRALGGRIEFVSNSPLSAAARAALEPLVDRVRLRENVGFDFGMWRDAIRELDLGGLDELVLTNSSVIGPLAPLAPVFARMDEAGWEFWGMTESHQFKRHLQTFFLVLKPRVLRSAELARFFDAVLPYRTKKSVILAYELGLTPFLWEAGFRGAAAFPSAELPRRPLADLLVRRRVRRARYEVKKNPTMFFPDRLLAGGMPYVKVELLRDHPRRARWLGLDRAVARFLAEPPAEPGGLAATRFSPAS